MIRLALTDLDNTLIPLGAPHASARAIRAVHAMLDAGLWFGPVSGRVPAAMRWMFDGDEACYRTGAFVNGQLVYADGELVHEELLDAADLAAVAELVSQHEGCALVVYDLNDISQTTDGAAYLLGISDSELERHAACFGKDPRVIDRLDQPSYIKANVRCDLPWPQMVALRDELRAAVPTLDFVFPALNGVFIDILPRGWSKGRAVEVLAAHLGVSLDEVATFGDSENDISMFEAAGHAVAVSNASADAAAAARYRIGAATDDAVAAALEDIAAAATSGEMPRFMRS